MQRHIQTHLEQIVSIITAVLDAQSIILLGSAARDELSMRPVSPDKIELFSDYECMVVVEKRPSPAQHRTLQTNLTRLEEEIDNPNPLFHIDVIIREQKRLKSLPPIIFTYEMKANGRVLYGRDCLPQIPTVTLENLDLQNTNEILYKRLWAVLLHLPETFITGQKMNTAEKRVTGYVLCRNVLDVTTVLLPHEAVLLSTYRQRVAKLKEMYPTLSLARDFGPAFPEFLQKSLDLRQTLQFDDLDLLAWYEETIRYLALALNRIGFEATEKISPFGRNDIGTGTTIYNEWPISRGEWYNLAQMSKNHTRQDGINKTIQWLRAPKKQWLTVGLLTMHQALIAWRQGDEGTAVTHLQQSQQLLNQLLMRETAESTAPFPQRWLNLRCQWAEFWQTYIRLNDSKYTHRFKSITTWQYREIK